MNKRRSYLVNWWKIFQFDVRKKRMLPMSLPSQGTLYQSSSKLAQEERKWSWHAMTVGSNQQSVRDLYFEGSTVKDESVEWLHLKAAKQAMMHLYCDKVNPMRVTMGGKRQHRKLYGQRRTFGKLWRVQANCCTVVQVQQDGWCHYPPTHAKEDEENGSIRHIGEKWTTLIESSFGLDTNVDNNKAFNELRCQCLRQNQ